MKPYENIRLDKDSTFHLYIQLYEKIREYILDEQIKEKEKLPPMRQLAELLSVNVVTVVKAYEMLEKEGYIYKKIGSGTFVTPRIGQEASDIASEKYPLDEDLRLMDRGQIQIKDHMYSFASATPTPDLFPVGDFQDLLNEVLNRDKGNAFGYQESQGYYALRESLVTYMKEYNIDTKTENIQIISGAQQGIDVIAKAFVNHGDVVILEKPTYSGAIATFKSRGAILVDVPMETDGIHISLLEESIKTHKPKVIYLMPNFQNPTGYSYSNEKKQKILTMAEKYNVLVIEDDYLSDLSFYDNNNTTLKSLDKKDLIIYIKSFSKIFMPGLRLGFLVLPTRAYHRILAAKHASDISTSGLIQRAFDLYLRKGIWKKHIHYMECIYRERFDIMKNVIEKYILPLGVQCQLPQGGLNFWLCLNEGYSSNQLYSRAAKKNVLLAPGSLFFTSENDSCCFRLSIAAIYPEEIEPAILILADVIQEYMGKGIERKNQNDSYSPLL
ncbi:MAG: PLP-dependent aminotransferase family protein [Thermotaleaceae bacterium]